MKFAILGGSFNPVHVGHLFLADTVLTRLGYDRLILVPAFQSPFKIGAEGASPDERMEMLAASIAGDPRLTIDDCELRREGVSYTIDTLKDIIARYRPAGKPGLVLGLDLASAFYKWRSPEEIAELADIIIARRVSEADDGGGGGEYGCKGDARVSDGPSGDFPYQHTLLDNETMDISSGQVREKISSGGAWHYLVPAGARSIIEDRFLYGHSPQNENSVPAVPPDNKPSSGIAATIVSVENETRASLGFGRFLHSRNTALLSWDLCRRFGLDPQKGYLAGIAHDMCKNMGEKELVRLVRSEGGSLSKLEKHKPSMLHARAAAIVLKRKYGIADRDILEAVRYHTTGKHDMSSLAKVVYIADKIEISRTRVDPALRGLGVSADLETLFSAVLNNTVAYLKSKQLDLSYGTKRLLQAMQKRNKL